MKRKELVACFPKDAGFDEACFKISYDLLIVGASDAVTTANCDTLALAAMDSCKQPSRPGNISKHNIAA